MELQLKEAAPDNNRLEEKIYPKISNKIKIESGQMSTSHVPKVNVNKRFLKRDFKTGRSFQSCGAASARWDTE